MVSNMGAIDGPMRYEIREDGALVEVQPVEVCRRGHALKPPNLSVGWDGKCRTYTCWTCYKAGEPEEVNTFRFTCGYDGTAATG